MVQGLDGIGSGEQEQVGFALARAIDDIVMQCAGVSLLGSGFEVARVKSPAMVDALAPHGLRLDYRLKSSPVLPELLARGLVFDATQAIAGQVYSVLDENAKPVFIMNYLIENAVLAGEKQYVSNSAQGLVLRQMKDVLGLRQTPDFVITPELSGTSGARSDALPSTKCG